MMILKLIAMIKEKVLMNNKVMNFIRINLIK